jgi:hypothetical protein
MICLPNTPAACAFLERAMAEYDRQIAAGLLPAPQKQKADVVAPASR